MAKVKLTGVVERIMRSNGKPTKMVVSIPVEQSAEVPLGDVVMQIESAQTEMFAGQMKPSGVQPRGRIAA